MLSPAPPEPSNIGPAPVVGSPPSAPRVGPPPAFSTGTIISTASVEMRPPQPTTTRPSPNAAILARLSGMKVIPSIEAWASRRASVHRIRSYAALTHFTK